MADRLTAIEIFGNPISSHCFRWRRASFKIQSPSGMISPVSSAIGIKRTGDTMPRVGWIQRTKASAALIFPVWTFS